MATLKVFDQFFYDMATGVHGDMNAATFKVRLSNTTPDKAAHDQAADATAITGGSYADGAVTLDWAETGAGTGVWQLGDADSDVTFTASGSAFTEFRYAYLYNDTATGDPLVSVLDYGSGITVPDGGSFTVNAGSSGWVQFTTPAWS